jgi:tRNA (guanine37-N1)-methyltransferase
MYFVQAPHKDAQRIQKELLAAGVLDSRTRVERDETHTFFPVTRAVEGYPVILRDGLRTSRPRDLKDALASVLSAQEMRTLISSYDIIGNIAIVDVPEALVSREKAIAQAVLDTHHGVSTVLKKARKHAGEFRTQQLSFVLGEETREAKVVESGCTLLVDVQEVYFSVRLSTERLRIARAITPGERVLVLFSGAGPYVCVLARHSVASRVAGVEKNPVGHRYAEENIRRNKLGHARVYQGDCANLEFLREFESSFERILLPLPASSEQFIGAALAVASAQCVLHVYKFGREGELPAIEGDIRARCAQFGFTVESVHVVRAGHHAPHVYRWCFDITVKRR